MNYGKILRKLRNTIDDYETQEQQEKADRVLMRLKYHLGMSNEWLKYANKNIEIKDNTSISVQEFINRLENTNKWNKVTIHPRAYDLHEIITKDNKYCLCFNLLKGKIGSMWLEYQHHFINTETQKDDYTWAVKQHIFNVLYDKETDKNIGRELTENILSYIDKQLFFINKEHIDISIN